MIINFRAPNKVSNERKPERQTKLILKEPRERLSLRLGASLLNFESFYMLRWLSREM